MYRSMINKPQNTSLSDKELLFELIDSHSDRKCSDQHRTKHDNVSDKEQSVTEEFKYYLEMLKVCSMAFY